MRNQLETWLYPRVDDYKSALEAWDKGPACRGKPNQRWLVRGHRDKWIARNDDASVSFVRGGVDMVRWCKDNSVVLTPWRSTAAFSQFTNAFIPTGLEANWGSRVGDIVVSDRLSPTSYRCYLLAGATRFKLVDGAWRPNGRTAPFVMLTLDKAKARAKLKAVGFGAFMDWATAVVQLGGWRRVNGLSDPRLTTVMTLMHPEGRDGRQHILAALANPQRWMELLTSPTLTHYAADATVALARAAKSIRNSLYIEENLFHVERRPYLESHKELSAFIRSTYEYAPAFLAARTRQ